MRRILTLTLACFACAPPSPNPEARPAPGAIVAAEDAEVLLHPCTRPGPAPIDGHWQPDTIGIRQLEAGLASYIRSASYQRPGFGPTRPLSRYRGQYTGFIQAGTQWIYASFAPAWMAGTTPKALNWCDGGGAYFGVEFNPETGEYRNLARNAEGTVKGN